MKVVALLSGGKDSLFNMHFAVQNGHEIVAIANLKPPENQNELDSYMYQTVGHEAIEMVAKALDRPLFRACITGMPLNQDLNYVPKDDSDEVEQLYNLLKSIRHDHGIEFDAVCVGAIASSYQKSRVESICERMELTMLAYLWNADQDELLQKMIDNKFDAILVKVACIGLSKDHVGLSIKKMQEHLRKLKQEYGTNICGEGGEYETLVLDCPLYKKRLVLDSYEIVCHSSDQFAPVYYLKTKEIHLEDK